jgi:hypothetical protein
MIAVTERAKKALLAKKLAAGVADLDVGLRLTSATDGTLLLVLDRATDSDHVVTYGDSTVLMTDHATAAFVTAGRIIDCRKNDEGRIEIILRHYRLGPHAAGLSEEPRSA